MIQTQYFTKELCDFGELESDLSGTIITKEIMLSKINIISVVLFLGICALSNLTQAQNIQGNVSGSLGVLNAKIRIQYEHPLNSRASTGVNMNWYLVNWTGPVFEPFIRLYNKKQGNEEGFFAQGKIVYGNLATLNFDRYANVLENQRWSTFGVGLNFGNKFLLGNHFTIEPLAGFRFMSPPVYRFKDGFDNSVAIGEGIGWYATTGLPVEFQIKFGYQF